MVVVAGERYVIFPNSPHNYPLAYIATQESTLQILTQVQEIAILHIDRSGNIAKEWA